MPYGIDGNIIYFNKFTDFHIVSPRMAFYKYSVALKYPDISNSLVPKYMLLKKANK
jgi:hypothetical protein